MIIVWRRLLSILLNFGCKACRRGSEISTERYDTNKLVCTREMPVGSVDRAKNGKLSIPAIAISSP